jgi:hypothetical protein
MRTGLFKCIFPSRRVIANYAICPNGETSIMPQRRLATAILAFHTRFDSERYSPNRNLANRPAGGSETFTAMRLDGV